MPQSSTTVFNALARLNIANEEKTIILDDYVELAKSTYEVVIRVNTAIKLLPELLLPVIENERVHRVLTRINKLVNIQWMASFIETCDSKNYSLKPILWQNKLMSSNAKHQHKPRKIGANTQNQLRAIIDTMGKTILAELPVALEILRCTNNFLLTRVARELEEAFGEVSTLKPNNNNRAKL